MKKQKGITIIALTITIIVILILAGVTISTLTGDNGLLTKAGEAKNASEIAEEKDIISISAIQAQSENKYGNLEESKFSKALNTNSKTENKASIIAEDIGSFTVKFESNRYYEVNKNGSISYIENVTGEKTLTIQCVNSKNEVLGEYEHTIVTDQYSKLPPAIDKYESAAEKIEGKITENKTIQVLYYLICDDDTTLVFTGLDSNGNITNIENNISYYMIGNDSNVVGNGLKDKTIKSILNIPQTYKEKEVIKVGQRAFDSCANIINISISDKIKDVGYRSFTNCSCKKIIIGKGLETWKETSFQSCTELVSVTIKSKANGFSGNTFYNCKKFTELKIDGNEEKYKVEDNILYSRDGKKLFLCPNGKTGEIVIPNTVEEIGYRAFNCGSLSKITRIMNM